MKGAATDTESESGPSAEEVAQWVLSRQLQILSYTRVIVKDMQLAEDIFQEVCVVAIRACGQFDSPEGTFRWAMRVARNRALDQLRRRKIQAAPLAPELLDKLADDWVEANRRKDERPYPESTFEQLEQCLDTLTPRTRRLLHLRYGEGRKPSEIALLFGQKVQAVYKAITRANAALKACMNKQVQPER